MKRRGSKIKNVDWLIDYVVVFTCVGRYQLFGIAMALEVHHGHFNYIMDKQCIIDFTYGAL